MASSIGDKSRVENIAQNLYSESCDFTMSHAVSATQNYLRRENVENPVVRVSFNKEIENQDSKNAGSRTFVTEYNKDCKDNEDITKFCYFDIRLPKGNTKIEYVHTSDVAKKDQGDFTHKEDCDRHIISHELGHLWLHLDVVMKYGGTKNQDSGKDVMEDEANCFARKLCRLRDEQLRKQYAGEAKKEMEKAGNECYKNNDTCWINKYITPQ